MGSLLPFKEGCTVSLCALARREQLDPVIAMLGKRVAKPIVESIVPAPHTLLQSCGEGLAENIVCSTLEIHCGAVVGEKDCWIQCVIVFLIQIRGLRPELCRVFELRV